ncbi:c-type cytochrome [Thauera linaloolentis]|uniref:Thiosulfate dehydrogenase n=1 Tax=Thauera linaloolentis (strain DSM 12138 / JCM 21573 / CCUG 41526 / CIP 105981 / IAM 15112 / NBRC 102519 / 47Lol) TaxID=1123367 RepID=N6YWS9_THAL4|nr:c-type cytochrome [Thauera linaloolentis]ENO86593.1 cytochrome c [Thauera linaloolentis 47Lol = DSM 12138]MCM8565779.1 c-type cytochrome [Thauera linaloolentis]
MKSMLVSSLAALTVVAPVLAAGIAMDDQSQLTPQPASDVHAHSMPAAFTPPAERDLPDNAFGKLVQEGRAIFVDTRNRAAEYVGNGMNCTNCHLGQGRKANSAPLWGAYPMYPAYRSKNDKVNSYVERMQGCFQFSMNGKVPPADSHVLNALTAYSYWLATGAPIGKELPGRAYPEIRQPKGGYDIAKGKAVYAERCAICHGDGGQGQKSGDNYVFPPLWGKDSFNWGAGMHRINTAASFIKESMPLGQGGSLTDAEAWHVAAFMNSHERPQDPRLVEGSVEKTRLRYHANDGVNLYGVEVNGVVLGQGVD